LREAEFGNAVEASRQAEAALSLTPGRDVRVLAAIAEMKKHHVAYIPTLSLDDFAFPYGDSPKWVGDPFCSAALDPGVLEMITSPEYLPNIWNWR